MTISILRKRISEQLRFLAPEMSDQDLASAFSLTQSGSGEEAILEIPVENVLPHVRVVIFDCCRAYLSSPVTLLLNQPLRALVNLNEITEEEKQKVAYEKLMQEIVEKLRSECDDVDQINFPNLCLAELLSFRDPLGLRGFIQRSLLALLNKVRAKQDLSEQEQKNFHAWSFKEYSVDIIDEIYREDLLTRMKETEEKCDQKMGVIEDALFAIVLDKYPQVSVGIVNVVQLQFNGGIMPLLQSFYNWIRPEEPGSCIEYPMNEKGFDELKRLHVFLSSKISRSAEMEVDQGPANFSGTTPAL